MGIINSLKKGALVPGVFAGKKEGPKPATIYIKIPYAKKFDYLRKVKGFKVVSPEQSNDPEGYIQFTIPVTPPTIQLDTGNTKDTEQIARIGEVVLAKYKKAIQVRWESFFPYDMSAPYLNSRTRSAFSDIGNTVASTYNSFVNRALNLEDADPSDYVQIFLYLSKSEKPFEVSMTYYNGGHLGTLRCTLDAFGTEPESNGDYKYNISVIEWTNIKPKQINISGEKLPSDDLSVSDKEIDIRLKGLSDLWDKCKQWYGVVSKPLIIALVTYNKIRNFAVTTELATWKIKGVFKKYVTRFSILDNILGKSKITRQDTQAITQSLRALSFTKASKQMADFLMSNISS